MKVALLFLSGIIFFGGFAHFVNAANFRDAVINEIAWSGTKASSGDEWIEFKNNTNGVIDLAGWGIYEQGGDVLIVALEGVIQPASFYLIERTDDNTIANIAASQTPKPFSGSGLSNAGEYLFLKDGSGAVIDSVNAAGGWFAGSASPDYFSMERIDSSVSGDEPSNWRINDGVTRNGVDAEGNPVNGTPLAKNSESQNNADIAQNIAENGNNENIAGNNNEASQSGQYQTNHPPQANAGNDIFTFLGETIQFDASKSSDSDGDKLTFEWNLGNGEIIKEEKFGYIYQFPGKYIVTLTVFDGKSESFDEITIDVLVGGITISEFLPSPKGSDEEGEWIEIYNSGDFLADLGGWQLDDIIDGGSNPWIFPARTFVRSKEYLIISREISKISLNNDKDVVRLIYPNGIVADEIVYEKAKEGLAGALIAGNFFWSKFLTPGAANILEAEVAKSLGAKPMNYYFVENFSEAYKNVIYSENDNKNKQEKNLVIIGGGETSSGILEELSISGVGNIGSKFVPSKNMLQAAAGNNFSSRNSIFLIVVSVFAGAGLFYASSRFRGKIKNKISKENTARSWEITVDE